MLLDLYTRILRRADVVASGTAVTFIPAYIRTRTPRNSRNTVVVDNSECALVTLLSS